MGLRLFDTRTRAPQTFEPITPGEVGMYCCGPTVYNFAHIGNLRTYVFEDLLRRALEHLGYRVHHVMNVTDVGHLSDDGDEGEDKMIRSAREQGKTVWQIAEFFTDAFFRDIDLLNVLRPEVTSKATEHISDMIQLVQRLEANGYTYQAGGNVYFDVSRFQNYGELARLNPDDLMHGASADVDTNKRNPQDFVLWFTNSKFSRQAMVWDSPWGRGYPGWHIECSAMSMRYLGDQFDIHCGGVDHVSVHHTNEIAQSEGATGRHPVVRYWLHGEFLVMDNAKMSKSSGGFITLQKLVDQGIDPLAYRYYLLGAHYRTQLQFSYQALESAQGAYHNLIQRIAALQEAAGEPVAGSVARLPEFCDALEDDLNIPRALAALWTTVKSDRSPAEVLADVYAMDAVFGLKLRERAEAFNSDTIDEDIRALIAERDQARASRDFARADRIRDDLARRGIILEDGPEGTRWKREL